MRLKKNWELFNEISELSKEIKQYEPNSFPYFFIRQRLVTLLWVTGISELYTIVPDRLEIEQFTNFEYIP